jgi:hypothetical protein
MDALDFPSLRYRPIMERSVQRTSLLHATFDYASVIGMQPQYLLSRSALCPIPLRVRAY